MQKGRSMRPHPICDHREICQDSGRCVKRGVYVFAGCVIRGGAGEMGRAAADRAECGAEK